MRMLLLASALLASHANAGPYEDCILTNMKGINDRLAAAEVRRACIAKTTPVRCRDAELERRNAAQPAGGIWIDFTRKQCIEECASASWWERTFGECRTG